MLKSIWKEIMLASVLVAMTALVTRADEHARVMNIQRALFCDTEEGLQILLTGIYFNDDEFPTEPVDGCGMFLADTTVKMLVTPMYWYETPSVDTYIAKFYHEGTDWTQFGWITYRDNEASSKDDGA